MSACQTAWVARRRLLLLLLLPLLLLLFLGPEGSLADAQDAGMDGEIEETELVEDDDGGYCQAQGLVDAGDGTCKDPDIITVVQDRDSTSSSSSSSSSSSASSSSSSSSSSSQSGSSSLPNPIESQEMMDLFKDTTDFVVSLVDGRLIAFDGCGTKLWTYQANSPTVDARFNETVAKGLGSGDLASHFAGEDPTQTPRIVPALDGTVYIVTPNPQSPSQRIFTHLPTLLEDMVSVAPFYSPAFPGMYVTGSKLQGGITVDFSSSRVQWHLPTGPIARYTKEHKLVFARQEWALHSLAAEDSEEVWRASYVEFPPVTHEHLFPGTEVNARARALTSVIGILDNQTSVYKKIFDSNRCPALNRHGRSDGGGDDNDEPISLVFDSPVVAVFAVVSPQDTPAKLAMVPVAHAGPWCHEFPGYDKLPVPSYVNMPHAYDGRPQLYPPFTYGDRHVRATSMDEEPYQMYRDRRRSPEPLQLALEGSVTLDEMASIFIKLNGPNKLFFGGLGGDDDGAARGGGRGARGPPRPGGFGRLPEGGGYNDAGKIRPLSLPGPDGSSTTVDPEKVHYLNDVARNTSLREFLAVKYQHNYIVLVFLLGLMGLGAVVYRFIAGWVQVFKVVAPDGENMSPGSGLDDDEMSEDDEMREDGDDMEDTDVLSMDLVEQPYEMGRFLDIRQDVMYLPDWQDVLLQASMNKRLQQFNDLTRIAFKHGESDVRTLHGGVLFLGRNVDDPQFIFRNPKQELSQRPNVPKYTQAVRNAVAGNAMKEVRYLKAYCPKACVASWNTFEGVIQDFVAKHPTDSHVNCRDVDPEVARDASLIIMALRDTDAHEDNMMRDKLGRIALFDLGCALGDRPLPRDDMTQEYLDNFAIWHENPLLLDAPFTAKHVRYLKSLDFDKLKKIWAHYTYPKYVVAEHDRARRRERLRKSSQNRRPHRSKSLTSPGVVRQAFGYLVSPKADPDPAESAIEDSTPEGDDSGQPPLPLQLPAAALQTGWSADHDGACSSPSAYHRRDSSDLGSDNATSSGEDAGSNEDSGSTRPKKGMTGRRVRAETIAVGRAATR
ncbi:hypothetical protein FOZ60_015078 [Perkinsus olseni]|uniref:PI3K/PI4K catalytic domain-containing protein n=1 Tax=Perkinsus olseni TaxID=32597 RepID=A0A7J6N6H0_PEROL|nr:hypothetical protein FOZ60_015078 [Perkinsus olseni]